MMGPYAVGDETGEYVQFRCPHCGHICERFLFELPGGLQYPLRRAWWHDDARWTQIRAAIRGRIETHEPDIYALSIPGGGDNE